MIYFSIKKLNENKTFLAMLGFLLVFNCSKDKEEGNGNGDATKYTLSITKPTNGTLSSKAGGIDCGSKGTTCKAEFSKDSKVTLTATADKDYAPAAWQGACDKTKATESTCKLTMDANKTAGKAFLKPTLSIDPKPINGTLSSKAGGIDCGSEGDDCKAEFSKDTEVTLTAKANTGYILGAWQGGCAKTKATESTCKLTMTTDKTAGKAFPIIIKHTLTITPPICGTVTNGDTINCGIGGSDCSAEFNKGTEVMLTATADADYTIGAWGGDCSGATCTLSMDTNKTVTKAFTASTTDTDSDCVPDATDIDNDNDGLIEVHNLDMFDHIRHNLTGTSYKTGADATDNRDGAPGESTADCKTATMDGSKSFYLCGYELTKDLDFAQGTSYADGSVNTSWEPNNSDTSMATNEGFVGATDFAGIFEGDGHSISNLYSRGGGYRGLFRSTTSTASIRNLGVVDANLYGSGASPQRIGALVGYGQGSISAVSATGGTVNGGGGDDGVGGLVGIMPTGTNRIIASYATGAVNGGGGEDDRVGGLVGFMLQGTNTILASYATGAVNGGGGVDYVGGLVGIIDADTGTNSIIASYATGAVNGDAGDDVASGLVGVMSNGTNSITASYATGAANGGAGSDHVGGLVGFIANGINTTKHSYGFGSGMREGAGIEGTTHWGLSGMGAAKANGLTAPGGGSTSAAAEWDDASEKTKDAWDFGTNSQAPALKYADYDGAGASSVDYCALFPAKIPGTNTDLECGTSLLPDQGR